MSWSLVGDIGGTNCRLARADGLQLTHRTKGDSRDLFQKIGQFADAQGRKPSAVVISAAGLVRNNILSLTNTNADMNIADLENWFSGAHVQILNDFEAAAWALDAAHPKDFKMLRGTITRGVKTVIGVGTGLGVGVWTGTSALKTEGGHITAYPLTELEIQMFAVLRRHWPDVALGNLGVEAEALLSGIGLPRVMNAYQEVFGQPMKILDAANVIASAQQNDQAAIKTLESFSCHLGSLVGDLFNAYWATGGIVLTGGVLRKAPHLLNDDFWQSLNSGGRYTQMRRAVPVALWANDDIGLMGSAAAAAKALR
ncbi:MAG: ROK family protein [Pseudomonadota bacterium]